MRLLLGNKGTRGKRGLKVGGDKNGGSGDEGACVED
jgi:hypothetical protein